MTTAVTSIKASITPNPAYCFFLKPMLSSPCFSICRIYQHFSSQVMKPLKLILYSRFSNILYHQFVANLLQNAVPRKTGRFSRDKSLWPLQRNVCVVKFFSKRQKCWRGKRGARSEKAGLFKFSDRYLSLLFQCIMIAK